MLRLLLFLSLTGCGEIDFSQFIELTVRAYPRGLDTNIETPVVLISNDHSATIYYTLDYTIPHKGSPVFDPANPVMVDKTTMIRFVAVSADGEKNSRFENELYRWYGPENAE